MRYLVNAIFFVVYYTITIPICALILIFWLVMLIVTIVLMVFAMVIETWRSEGVPSRPMAVIERVKTKGPALIGNILDRPLRKLKDEDAQTGGVFALIYSEGFTGLVIPVIAFALVAVLGAALSQFGGGVWRGLGQHDAPARHSLPSSNLAIPDDMPAIDNGSGMQNRSGSSDVSHPAAWPLSTPAPSFDRRSRAANEPTHAINGPPHAAATRDYPTTTAPPGAAPPGQ